MSEKKGRMNFTEDSDDYKAYLDMCGSEAYLHLRQFYGKKTLFDILGVARQENPHSNFLAWLLDPGESHGMNDFAMKRFLETACFAFMKYGVKYLNEDENSDYKNAVKQKKDIIDQYFLLFGKTDSGKRTEKQTLRKILMQGNYRISRCAISREKNLGKDYGRADIYMEITIQHPDKDAREWNLLVLIENKIKSGENGSQTSKYMKYLLDRRKTGKCFILPVYLCAAESKEMENWADGSDSNAKISFENHLFMILNYQYLLDGVFVPCKAAFYDSSVRNVLEDYMICLGKSINEDAEENEGDFLVIAVGKEEREWSLKLWEDHKKVLLAAAEEIENIDRQKDNFLIHGSNTFDEQFYRTVLLLIIRYGSLDENDEYDRALLEKKDMLLTNRKRMYRFKGEDYASGARGGRSLGNLAHAILRQYVEENKDDQGKPRTQLTELATLLRSKWKMAGYRGVIISRKDVDELYKEWQKNSAGCVCKWFDDNKDCDKNPDETCPLYGEKIDKLLKKMDEGRYCLCYYDFLRNFYVGSLEKIQKPDTDPDWKSKNVKGINTSGGPIQIQDDDVYLVRYYWHAADIEALHKLLKVKEPLNIL